MRISRISLAIVLVVLLISSCETLPTGPLFSGVEKPEIQSISPRITGLDFEGVDLAFDCQVLNPYSVPIKTPRFKYGLDVQGKDFLDSQTTSEVDLPAKQVGTVVLPVRLGYRKLWRSYQSLKDETEIPYTLHGALVLSALGEQFELPMKKSGSFPVLRIPKFSSLDLQTSEVSLGSAEIGVTAQVRNPNIFALGLDNLGYDLRIGDIEVGNIQAKALESIGAGETREVSLSGKISGIQAVQQFMAGESIGKAMISPRGSIDTPYGSVKLPE